MNIQPLVEMATTGIRFCFEVTLDDRQVMRMMSTVHEPRKLPVILSPEEVKRLLDATTNLKYQADSQYYSDTKGIVRIIHFP